jgi:hypothetical protein
MKVIPEGAINEIVNRRLQLEVQVAQSIGECIKDHSMTTLRAAIRLLLAEVCDVPKETLNPVIKGKYAMFEGHKVTQTREGLVRLCYEPGALDLATCSDIIRLFGEVAEKDGAKDLTGSKWQVHFKSKERLKPFPIYMKPGDTDESRRKKLKPGEKDPQPDPLKRGWDEGIAHRRRDERKGEIPRSGAPYVDLPRTVNRGVDKFEFLPGDVIATIDRTFGLAVKGGDISGTTTDSMYALKYALGSVNAFNELSLVQLLPIATMVPAGHHSLVECAWPLSRWHYIDYCIGYYDTLMPKNCVGTAKGGLEKALGEFQKEADGMHVLVYRGETGKQEGLLMQTPFEINEFKRMARVRSAYGWCVANGQDRRLLLNVMESYNKDLRKSVPPPIPSNQGRPEKRYLIV